MNILLLNAGSSSLKCTLMEAADSRVIARSLADWAGSVTRYQYAGPDGKEHTEEVSWKGHAEAVRRFLHDLVHTEPFEIMTSKIWSMGLVVLVASALSLTFVVRGLLSVPIPLGDHGDIERSSSGQPPLGMSIPWSPNGADKRPAHCDRHKTSQQPRNRNAVDHGRNLIITKRSRANK